MFLDFEEPYLNHLRSFDLRFVGPPFKHDPFQSLLFQQDHYAILIRQVFTP